MTVLDKSDWLGLGFFIFIQFIGGYVPVDRNEYSRGSKRIKGAPPGWLFGPIWIVLKFLRGFAGFLFWYENSPLPSEEGSRIYSWTLSVYFVNILLDIQWMPLFFGQKAVLSALVVIALIWTTSIVCLIFFSIEGIWVAFVFFVVYSLWLTYAFYLNYNWWAKMIWVAIENEKVSFLPLPASVKPSYTTKIQSEITNNPKKKRKGNVRKPRIAGTVVLRTPLKN